MFRLTAAALIACTAALTACDMQTLEFDHQTKSGTAITEVIVDVHVGTLTVVGTREPGAKAHVGAEFGSPDFRPAVDFREEGSKLYITTKCGNIELCRTDIELSMPEGAVLRADGEEADITAKDLRGAIFATIAIGNIQLDNVSGALDLTVREGSISGDDLLSTKALADTVKGKVDLVFLAPVWDITVNNTRGDIKLTVPDLVYQVKAATASGTADVRVDNSAGSRRLLKANISEAGNILIAPLASNGGA